MADADRIAEERRKLEVDLAYRDELARRIGLERQLGPAEAMAEADARMSTLTDQIRRNRRSYALAQHHWWVRSALDQTEEDLAKAPGLGTEPILALSQLADLDGMNPSAEYLFATAATVLGDGSKLEEIASLATAIKTRVHAFLKARGHLWHQTIVKGPALFLEPRGREESRDAFFAKWAEEPNEKIEEKLSLGLTLARAEDGTWQPNITNGLLTVDQLLADLLEELGDKASAETMRASELGETHVKIWRRWIPFRLVPELYGLEVVAELGDKADMPPAVLAIASAVQGWLAAERATPRAVLLQTEHLGATYVQVPKVVGGIAWSFGTTGEVVDGDRYQAAPNVTRYVSRSIGLVPEGRARQQLLPVDVAHEPLAVRVLTDAQAVVSGVGGKLALLLAVAAREDGGLCKMTVAELCRALWPDARIQKRDRERAVQTVRQLRSLAVVLPNGVDFPLWQIAAPDVDNLDPNLEVTFGWSTFAKADEFGGKVVSMLRGKFLLNFDGAMRLPADHALELRTYVHAAAGWNEARRGADFDPKFAPKGTIDELAARVNALSAPALEHLREKTKGRRQAASDDRKRMKVALERLDGDACLIRLEKVARDTYAMLPPEALLEAHRLMREQGRRPK